MASSKHPRAHKPKSTEPPQPRLTGLDGLLGPGGVRGSNIYAHDESLRELLKRMDVKLLHHHEDLLNDFGSWVGSAVDGQAEYTNSLGPPRLEAWDRNGGPNNRILHNPHYSHCHREIYRRGLVALNHGNDRAPYLLTFSMGYLLSQADLSLHLSVALNAAVAFMLAHHAPADLRRRWLPGLLRRDGTAMTASTWTTELSQPGGDPQTTTTSARKSGNDFLLDGLKWFACSPDCDLALVSAHQQRAGKAADGLGLFLVPRRLENGQLNHFLIRRLKNKLGTCGLATGEVELNSCWAQQLSAPPNGVAALQAGHGFIRLHAALAGVASQRRAMLEGLDYTAVRLSRGRHVTRNPMVQDRLIAIRCEYEANMELVFTTATDFERSVQAPQHTAWQRLLVCLAKYRGAVHAVEATAAVMEMLGSSGYIEDYPIARLHRDALALNVWGGSSDQLAAELLPLLSSRFDIRDRFGQHVRGLLDRAPIRASRQSGGLRRALAEYQEVARYLHRFPEAGERLGPHLLTLMADLLAGALLLEAAGRDLRLGDARRALLLHSYLTRHFPDTSGHLNIKTDEYLKYFEQLVTAGPIDINGDWEQGLKNRL